MKRNFVCPNCGKIASADESATGRRARCSQCGNIFVLTADSPSIAAPRSASNTEPRLTSASASASNTKNSRSASVSNDQNKNSASVSNNAIKTTSDNTPKRPSTVDSLIANFDVNACKNNASNASNSASSDSKPAPKPTVASALPTQGTAHPNGSSVSNNQKRTSASVSSFQTSSNASVLNKPSSVPAASEMESPLSAASASFDNPFATEALDASRAGGLLNGIENFDSFAAAEQRRQALNPTNVPRGNNRPKPAPTNRRPVGVASSAPRCGSRDETLLQYREKALSAFLSCLVLGLIIGVVNLLLNAFAPGRLALGLSGAGTLFVFATTLRFFYYATRMLAQMWGAVGVLVGILNAFLFPFYFMYIVYFIIAGRRGNGAAPVSAKKMLITIGIICGVLIGAPILFAIFGAIISVASTAADRAEVARQQRADKSAQFITKRPNPSNDQIDEMRKHVEFPSPIDYDDSPSDVGFRSPAVRTPSSDFGGSLQPGAANVVVPEPATAQKKKPSDFKPLKYALDGDGKIKIDALKSSYLQNVARHNDANLDGFIDESEFGTLYQECPPIAHVDHSEFEKSDFAAQAPGETTPNVAPTGVSTVPTTRQTPEEIAAQKAESDARFDQTFNKTLQISEFVDGKPIVAKSVGDQGVPLEALKEAGFPEDVVEIYRQVDKNGDGFISHSEDGEAFHLKHEARVKKMREKY